MDFHYHGIPMDFDVIEILDDPSDTQGNVAMDAWSLDMPYPDYCDYALRNGVSHFTEEEYQVLCTECSKQLMHE